MNPPRHIITLASENDALVGGKVGGVGDVVKHLPRALAELGWKVDIIIPSYGFLHQKNPSSLIANIRFPFHGDQHEAGVWNVTARQPHKNITHLVIDHPGLKADSIYYNDLPSTPFKHDATKYALFCSAAGRYLADVQSPYILQLHDWHAATVFLLRELHPAFAHLKGIPTAFTVHNLAIQGTRPMRGDESSVETWFPELFRNPSWVQEWKDPRYPVPCYAPMAVGIKHADKVNTVSPTYAEEILQPSDPERGFYGGEGLEKILQETKKEKRLFGILNGCEYPDNLTTHRLSFTELGGLVENEVTAANTKRPEPYNDELLKKLPTLKELQPSFLFTTVTRIVDQKVKLFFEKDKTNSPAIDRIMEIVDRRNGACFILGTGTSDYEQRLMEASRKHKRLIFIKGYFEKIGQALYASGTLFLMPSSFEPCGISQMIAMREGQPCIVHAVGGLKDTVQDGVNGFTFSGATSIEQAESFIRTTEAAITLALSNDTKWRDIVMAASGARFTWEKSARQYIDLMYSSSNPPIILPSK